MVMFLKLHRSVKFEKKTLETMIGMYGRHATRKGIPGVGCEELQAYAFKRIDKCRFGDSKPNCKDCPVHCYTPEMKEKIKVVMRYAGPRMIYRHPIMALRHLLFHNNINSNSSSTVKT
jgi:hypothetical protein